MKTKTIKTFIVICILSAGMQMSDAGDREWATAGKILTGVVAGAIIADSIQDNRNPNYYHHSHVRYHPNRFVVENRTVYPTARRVVVRKTYSRPTTVIEQRVHRQRQPVGIQRVQPQPIVERRYVEHINQPPPQRVIIAEPPACPPSIVIRKTYRPRVGGGF